jgi:hypothetical protein
MTSCTPRPFRTSTRRMAALLASMCASACEAPAGDDDASTTSATTTDDGEDESGDSEGELGCVPPARPNLAEIPDRPSLAAVGQDTLAAFEVDGDRLIGKYVRDADAAEHALELWQELVLRIPVEQRPDLVQLNVYGDTDPVAWVDGTGVGNQVGRYGFTIAFSAENFELDPGDPCAPLAGHRGTFDWTLVHELHHMRGRADGTVDAFTVAFPHVPGDGEGYPDDGSPALDRDYVSSYAERSSGDEDAAESFTAYVMLDELPAQTDALATAKVRWFDAQPQYAALRRALRITEGETRPTDLEPAPRAVFPFELAPPAWIHGTWEGTRADGVVVQFRFEPADVTYVEIVDGIETEVSRYMGLRDDGTLATLTQHVASSEKYSYTKLVAGEGGTESFDRIDDDHANATLEALGDAGPIELARIAP